MKAILSIGVWALFLINSCSNQSPNPVTENNNSNEAKKKILISFIEDDSTVTLHDDFTVFFVKVRDTLHLSSINNELTLPMLKNDTGYSVLFKYMGYNLYFKGLTKQMILPGQDVEWKFGVDNRPFNKLTGLLSDEEYTNDIKTKQLQYLQFNLLEQGDGIQFVNKIGS